MSFLVIGCGFVGETVAQSLEEQGKSVVRIDPKYNDNKIKDWKDKATGVIIAVPTPTVDGKCDDSIIRTVLNELNTETRVLLKCTVPPSMLSQYSKNVTYNPEFLRAKTAKEDWDNQKNFVLGGSEMDCYFWSQVFSYLDVNFITTDRNTASMVKYMHNAWLATKVAFFHEIYYNKSDMYNHKEMTNILSLFENIGPSHMQAPNDEGKLGYGGHCFPKDTQAFYDFTDSKILKAVIETNEKLNEVEKDDSTRNN